MKGQTKTKIKRFTFDAVFIEAAYLQWGLGGTKYTAKPIQIPNEHCAMEFATKAVITLKSGGLRVLALSNPSPHR